MNLKIDKLSKEYLPMTDSFYCTERKEELLDYTAKKRRRIIRHSREMEDFIRREALEDQEKGLNTTHLLIDIDTEKIAAYVSLCNDSIRLALEEREDMKLIYTSVPAIKIARLAVSNEYKHQGLGKFLIQFSAFIGKKIREVSGLVFITLDCYEHRVSFYESMGFVRNQVQSVELPFDSPVSMRLKMDAFLERIAEDS